MPEESPMPTTFVLRAVRAVLVIPLVAVLVSCAAKEPEFPKASGDYAVEEIDFAAMTREARAEVGWYPEWTELHGETLPEPLPPQPRWKHPFMQQGERMPSAMHEDAFASDVSNNPGPTPEHLRVHYFQVREKGPRFSGMCPLFAFVDDDTLVTVSFGRNAATALLVDVSEEPVLLDAMPLPGRGSSGLELARRSARLAIFQDTSGGAYSYLSQNDELYVPGAQNEVIRIPIRDRRFVREEAKLLRLDLLVEKGSFDEASLSDKEKQNKLTAIMPDADGHIWFTTKYSVVGLIDLEDLDEDGLPQVHATHLGYYATREKAIQGLRMPPAEVDAFLDIHDPDDATVEELSELRSEFRELAQMEADTREEVQNSFTVDPTGGVYIVSNFALYKLRFDADRQRIVLDPKWAPTYAEGGLIYANDGSKKPGHLNRGSGTTPTLVGDRFVVICDNAPKRVNLLVFRQDTGEKVFEYPLFAGRGGAVENSVVAYRDSLIVANTYGYEDPFQENDTVGGIMRFDFDPEAGTYAVKEGWPATGHFDGKTATPKLSTPNGLIYVYNRADEAVDGHHDWQLTALDYRTGLRVFHLKGVFDDRHHFDDNTPWIMKAFSLGTKNYDRKVFNNLWGTFSFGPDGDIYIGAYRGFVRYRSGGPMSDGDATRQ
jgi:hypothetical protein